VTEGSKWARVSWQCSSRLIRLFQCVEQNKF
jgi:hypothetical protein